MPEAQEYTTDRGWRIPRKASNAAEVRDWWDEFKASLNDADADVQSIVDTISGLTAAFTAYDHIISGLIVTQVMATVADTPIVLTNQSPRNIMLTGSASGVPVVLPDATTLSVGDTWTIKNASSEFVVVQNSGTASSAFEFVAPRASIEIACSGKANAAGTWVWDRSDYLKMKSMKGRDYDTLDNNTISNTSASGTGAAVNQGVNGNLAFFTGTTTTGRSGGSLNATSFVGTSGNQGAMILDISASFSSGLSVLAEEYWAIFGIHSQHNGTIENGFFWRYDRLGYGDDNIRRVLSASGSMPPTDSGIKASIAYRRFTIITNSAKNRVDWYINKALVGTDTGVTFANILEPDFVIVKSAGSTNRQLRIDRISYWVALPERI